MVRTELEAMLSINEAPKDFYFVILYYYRLQQEFGAREKVLGHGIISAISVRRYC